MYLLYCKLAIFAVKWAPFLIVSSGGGKELKNRPLEGVRRRNPF